MKNKTKNIISIILPLFSLFAIAAMIKTQPTGLAVYENKTLYRINGTISISLQDNIPVESYIKIEIGSTITKISLFEFLEKSGKPCKLIKEGNEEYILGEGDYSVNINDLVFIKGFEKGDYMLKTEIIYGNAVLYSDHKVINI